MGRRRELRQVQRLVSHARLVTFVGSGGCGKTRLALELSRRIVGDVVWVSLAHLRRGEDVRHEVARGLDVASPARLAEGLADRRNGAQMLLVLDNCEHVIEAAAAIAVELLSAQPSIRVLATSREPLDVEGELLWRVPPLSLPDELSQDDPQRSGRTDSVRLFVERAQLAHPGFSLDHAACRSVVAICRAVDGIPLAIELAAARLRHANVADLATRLDDLLALLVSTRRVGDSRHRGLRAALDWSHSLLDERQRSVLRRLSVFAGGFTIAAAESVCADDRLPEREVLTVVASLVDKSLLVPPTDGDRYRMLEPVREYASELLGKSAEKDMVTERCIAYLVDLVTAEVPDTMGVGGGPSIRRVSNEFANLNAVLPGLIDRRPADAVRVLSRFAQNHWGLMPAHLSTVSAWLSRALAAHVARDATRVEGLLGQVQAMLQQDHDHVAARRLADEAVAISKECGDELLRARALSRSAFVASWDDPPRALREYDSAIPVLRRFHPGALALALAGRAVLRQRSGDAREADQDLSESFAAWQRQKVELSLSPALTFIAAADVAFQRGEISRAVSYIKEAILIEQRFHALSPQLIGHLVSPAQFAAHLAALQGDYATALRLDGFADRMHYESGALPRPWFALSDRAWVRDLETRLGARAQKIRAEGRNLSGAQAVALALGKRPATSLTSRELAVCALVADGLTDKEIASHLSISERTAESHVQRIREKLKFRSRTQIGRWAAEQAPSAEAAVQ